jgi:hypothetical protein
MEDSMDIVLPEGVKSVTIISPEAWKGETPNAAASVEVYREEKGKKKQTRGLRGVGKFSRRLAEAVSTMSDNYLERHDRSNEKRRDGWARDYSVNVFKANQKGMKKLKLFRP